jgi:hypothetical protein
MYPSSGHNMARREIAYEYLLQIWDALNKLPQTADRVWPCIFEFGRY